MSKSYQSSSEQESSDSDVVSKIGSAISQGNAFVQSMIFGASDETEQSAAEEAQKEGSHAAVEAKARIVHDIGGYVFKQEPDGFITILKGPVGAGYAFPSHSPVNLAITAEIGFYSKGEGSNTGNMANVSASLTSVLSTAMGGMERLQEIKDNTTEAIFNTVSSVIFGPQETDESSPVMGPQEEPVVEAQAEDKTTTKSPEIPDNHHQNRTEFVRDSVQEISATSQIIDTIFPYFPKSSKVIGGFLDNSQQAWKINYHWEYMRDLIIAAKGNGADSELDAVYNALGAVPPSGSGYRGDKNPGDTADSSTSEEIVARWRVIRAQKKILDDIWDQAKPWNSSRYTEKNFRLASAPVAKPGTSTHGSGKALDISGDNAEISRISKRLNASMAFDEASHVHVEFLSGINDDKNYSNS